MLTSFVSVCFESFGKWEPQLIKYPYQIGIWAFLQGIFLFMIAVGGTSSLWVVAALA